MAQDYNESTRVMPVPSDPPIDRTMVASTATAPPPAGATQMGTTVTCAVCSTANPGLETYCVECGFLLTSAPGAAESVSEPDEGSVELVETASGRRFRLRPGVNSVGRENCDILLLDGTVSRRHAEVKLEDGSVTVTDLGSTNGTQVDGNRLSPNQPVTVSPGAVVRFGNATLALPGPAGESAPAEATIVVGGGSDQSAEQTMVGTPPAVGEAPELPEEAGDPVTESGAAARLRGAAGVADIILREGSLTIGRRPGNDVVLSDAYVSGQHARLDCVEGSCTLSDLGSTNGTTVNGARLEANQPQQLVDGDEVQIGQSVYRFETLQPIEQPEPEESAPSDDFAETDESHQYDESYEPFDSDEPGSPT